MSLSNARTFRRIVELEINEMRKEKIVSILRNGQENGPVPIQNNTWVTPTDSKRFDPNNILDEKYQVKSAGSHFYEIGLSLINANNSKRLCFHNVYANFTMVVIIMTRSIISMLIPEGYENIRIYIGDFPYFLNSVYHLNPCIFLMFTILLSSIKINMAEYKAGKPQSHLNLFGIISGKCSPGSLGLTNELYITKMTKLVKYGEIMVRVFSTNVLFISCLLAFVPLIQSFNWFELILFGLPWSFLFAASMYFGLKIFTYQILYLVVTSYFLMSKLR